MATNAKTIDNLLRDNGVLNKAIVAVVRVYGNVHDRLHLVFMSTLAHVVKHGNPASLNHLYAGMGGKDANRVSATQRQMRTFVARMHKAANCEVLNIVRGAWVIIPNSRTDDVKARVDDYLVKEADTSRPGFVRFMDRDSLSENRLERVDDNYIAKAVRQLLGKIAEKKDGTRELAVSPKMKAALEAFNNTATALAEQDFEAGDVSGDAAASFVLAGDASGLAASAKAEAKADKDDAKAKEAPKVAKPKGRAKPILEQAGVPVQ